MTLRVRISRKRWGTAATFREAAAMIRDFLDRNGLGASEWYGGQVTDEAGNPLARISYNGRVWANDGTEIES